MDWKGKKVFLTGASTGIGRELRVGDEMNTLIEIRQRSSVRHWLGVVFVIFVCVGFASSSASGQVFLISKSKILLVNTSSTHRDWKRMENLPRRLRPIPRLLKSIPKMSTP